MIHAQFLEKKITHAMNDFLSRSFTKEEVIVALKQMALLKSPGPDGFNPNFY